MMQPCHQISLDDGENKKLCYAQRVREMDFEIARDLNKVRIECVVSEILRYFFKKKFWTQKPSNKYKIKYNQIIGDFW
jgi:hypothetical protein